MLSCGNQRNLLPFSPLPLVTEGAPHGCLVVIDHFLTPGPDLQETPLSNTDFLWFTIGSSLKGNTGKYCAGYAIINVFLM